GGADHLIVARAQQQLLEHGVGNAVVDQDLARRQLARIGRLPEFLLGDALFAELLRGDLITPIAEGALCELLDIALVHQRDHRAALLDGMADRLPHQPLRPGDRDRLDTNTRIRPHRLVELLPQKADQLLGLGCAFLELDAGVDILGVLAEDDHVQRLRLLHGRGHARVVAHRAHAGVQVHFLADADVEAADPAADRRGQWPLDRDSEVARGLHRILGQPLAEALEGLLAGEDLIPGDAAFAAVAELDGGVPHRAARLPDVTAGAVALDERDNGVIGDDEFAVPRLDRFAGRYGQAVVRSHFSPSAETINACPARRRRAAPTARPRWPPVRPAAKPNPTAPPRCRPAASPPRTANRIQPA